MKKYTSYLIASSFAILVLLLLGYDIMRHESYENHIEKIVRQEKKQDLNSAKQLRKEYDSIIVGDKKNLNKQNATNIKDIKKILGNPIYTSTASTDGLDITTQEWCSGTSNELPALLTVNLLNTSVVEKSISNVYVPYNTDLLVTKSVYNNIKINGTLSMKEAIKNYGEPNSLSEYINSSGQVVDSLIWGTNVSGALDSFFNLSFINGKVVEKTESGLV
ncbi:DUF3862 domain-containing protein [Lactococcus garvieae]|uniref:DUF3862 domain-containing protein n=1 Tax=Lactococcus garvieae TaxID=1363 RepID=A0A1I4IRX6_9LACT|nr:DUF3862 domain-containing protein [Lactococcus garvieae]SFL56601.1 protein of unknown function [Lactococcus garvieae]